MKILIPEDKLEKLRDYLATHHIPSGLGTEDEACSIAAINLALTGNLIDSIPDCMSSVIGRWIIRIQDKMPDSIRNSKEWKQLLPLAAGTGRDLEKERLEIIMQWMWNVLSRIQHIADKHKFGEKWKEMILYKNAHSTNKAKNAAYAKADADAAFSAANAANAASYSAYANADADAAADVAASYAADAAYAAYAANADAASYAAKAAACWWDETDPCGLLRKLCNL